MNREVLINALDSISPGLCDKPTIDQGTCFIFSDGNVFTFNENVACSRPVEIDIEGAVPSKTLMALLRKLPDENLTIRTDDNRLTIQAKGRRGSIAIEPEILLPISAIESPDNWQPLTNPETFCEAIQAGVQCAGSDENQFLTICVHITPHYVEATDNMRAGRFKVETGIPENVLVRADSIAAVPTLGLTEFALTETWLHLRGESGLVYSCRRWPDSFHNLTPHLEATGARVTLPKGLGDAVDRAAVFAREAATEKATTARVAVDIRATDGGRLRVRGESAAGWFEERKTVKYSGPPISFLVTPELLRSLLDTDNKCTVSERVIRVATSNFVYVASLFHNPKDE